MTHAGLITSVRVGLFQGGVTGTVAGPQLSTLKLAIARQSPPGSGTYYIDQSTVITLPTITSFVDLSINIPALTVQVGDIGNTINTQTTHRMETWRMSSDVARSSMSFHHCLVFIHYVLLLMFPLIYLRL